MFLHCKLSLLAQTCLLRYGACLVPVLRSHEFLGLPLALASTVTCSEMQAAFKLVTTSSTPAAGTHPTQQVSISLTFVACAFESGQNALQGHAQMTVHPVKGPHPAEPPIPGTPYGNQTLQRVVRAEEEQKWAKCKVPKRHVISLWSRQ